MYVQFNALINVSVQDSAESNLALYGINSARWSQALSGAIALSQFSSKMFVKYQRQDPKVFIGPERSQRPHLFRHLQIRKKMYCIVLQQLNENVLKYFHPLHAAPK